MATTETIKQRTLVCDVYMEVEEFLRNKSNGLSEKLKNAAVDNADKEALSDIVKDGELSLALLRLANAYILMMIGQKTLRPTVISMYNYVQPIVGTSVSILLGMGTFGVAKGIAVALVFTGVYIVTQSKSREQMLAEQAAKKE